jgi:hypothetical protein
MYCKGCHSDQDDVHWDAECRILLCCVVEKGLDNCSQCQVFPCEMLTEWAGDNPKYIEALDRLKSIADNK